MSQKNLLYFIYTFCKLIMSTQCDPFDITKHVDYPKLLATMIPKQKCKFAIEKLKLRQNPDYQQMSIQNNQKYLSEVQELNQKIISLNQIIQKMVSVPLSPEKKKSYVILTINFKILLNILIIEQHLINMHVKIHHHVLLHINLVNVIHLSVRHQKLPLIL